MKGTARKIGLSTMVMMMGLGAGVTVMEMVHPMQVEAAIYFDKYWKTKGTTKLYDYEGVKRGEFPKGIGYYPRKYDTINGKTFVRITIDKAGVGGAYWITMSDFYRDTH